MVLKIRVYATFVNLKIAKDAVVFRSNTFYTCKAFWVTFMYISLYVFIYLSFDVHLFILTFIHTISSHFNVFFHLSCFVWFQVAFQTKASQGRCLASCKGVWEFLGSEEWWLPAIGSSIYQWCFFDLGPRWCFSSLFIPVFNSTWGNIHSYVD